MVYKMSRPMRYNLTMNGIDFANSLHHSTSFRHGWRRGSCVSGGLTKIHSRVGGELQWNGLTKHSVSRFIFVTIYGHGATRVLFSVSIPTTKNNTETRALENFPHIGNELKTETIKGSETDEVAVVIHIRRD